MVPTDQDPELVRYQTKDGNFVTNYTHEKIDLDEFEIILRSTHQFERISGDSNNCWMRAIWMGILLQLPPETVGARLRNKLHGAEYDAAIQTIQGAADDIAKDGLNRKFVKGKFSAEVEAAFARLSYGLLIARVRSENLDVDESTRRINEIRDSTLRETDGNTEQIAMLAQDLGIDLIVLSRHTAEPTVQGNCIETSCRPDSALNAIPMHVIKGLTPEEQRFAKAQNARIMHGQIGARLVVVQEGGLENGHFTAYRPA